MDGDDERSMAFHHVGVFRNDEWDGGVRCGGESIWKLRAHGRGGAGGGRRRVIADMPGGAGGESLCADVGPGEHQSGE